MSNQRPGTVARALPRAHRRIILHLMVILNRDMSHLETRTLRLQSRCHHREVPGMTVNVALAEVVYGADGVVILDTWNGRAGLSRVLACAVAAVIM